MDEEVFDVYEDEDGNEFIIVDGQREYINEDDFEISEAEDEEDVSGDAFNPLAYDNVQAATDVMNDVAKSGGSIVREGAALAGELKEAMDDIGSLLDFKSWLK